jgi:uncharacterized protein
MNERTLPTGSITIETAGESFLLLPERAVFWDRSRTLLIADPHFGKAQTFRSAGIPAPETSHHADLQLLSQLIKRHDANTLIVLGDLLHARSGVRSTVLNALSAWRASHPDLDITLVRGNHDRSAGDPPSTLGIRCIDPGEPLGPFRLHHEPPTQTQDGYALCGHIHPGFQLGGRGRLGSKTSARFPAFIFGSSRAILPAFGRLTGLATVPPEQGDRVCIIAGEEVIALDPA